MVIDSMISAERRHRIPPPFRCRAGQIPVLLLMLLPMLIVFAAFSTDAEAANDPAGGAEAASVGVLSAGANSTDVRIVADLADVLDGQRLRVVPIIGQGGLRNVQDLLSLPVADVAIIQADVAAEFGKEGSRKDLGNRLVYIAKLFNEEVHILARKEIGALGDLSDRAVAVGPMDSGSSLTAGAIFAALSIPIRPVFEPLSAALPKLRAGEIDAVVYVAAKPSLPNNQTAGLAAGGSEAGDQPLHFLAIPVNERLLEDYVPSALTHQDYPELIGAGETVETVSVPMVMVAEAKPAAQSGAIDAFVQAFFSRFVQLQEPQRHPKWRETNLAATVPGWQRVPAAVDWIRANMATPDERKLQDAFTDMLRFVREQNIKLDAKLTEQQTQALFWRFVDWRAEQVRP